MKKIYYFLLHYNVWNRAVTISDIRKDKQERLRRAIEFVKKWPDTPLESLHIAFCRILKARPSDETWDLLVKACF